MSSKIPFMGLSSEDQALVDAGAFEETEDEVDQIQEQVTALATITTESRTQILERLDTCLNRLESLSTTNQAENPLLTQALGQIAELKGEVMSLKSSMDTMSTNLLQRELTPPIIILPERNGAEDHQEVEIPPEVPAEVPAEETEPGPTKKINRKVF